MRDTILKNLLVNLRAAFSINIRKRINENTSRLVAIEDFLVKQQSSESYHYYNILDYYARHRQEAPAFANELEYLRRLGRYCNFPYRPDEGLPTTSGRDETSNLPYVVHNGKRLFFPESFSVEETTGMYMNYLQTEKLLGMNETGDAPHRYQSPAVHVEEGDAVFDIGAAEGLFALDQVDKASHVVIVENDPQWLLPLQHTFAPYKEKVTIIHKLISSTDTAHTLSLKSLLTQTNYSSAFIKMDIEGFETSTIASAADFLKETGNIKIAAAAYHRQYDADELATLLDSIGYSTEFSKGYMLFHMYDTPVPPFFRHGIIRAKKA